MLPPQCPRCGLEFTDQEELNNHLRSVPQCDNLSISTTDGICGRKLKLLKCKKKNTGDPGEEGRWRDVYRILFPGAPIPSPCECFETKSHVCGAEAWSNYNSKTLNTALNPANQELLAPLDPRVWRIFKSSHGLTYPRWWKTTSQLSSTKSTSCWRRS
jgi:hypothetical protein